MSASFFPFFFRRYLVMALTVFLQSAICVSCLASLKTLFTKAADSQQYRYRAEGGIRLRNLRFGRSVPLAAQHATPPTTPPAPALGNHVTVEGRAQRKRRFLSSLRNGTNAADQEEGFEPGQVHVTYDIEVNSSERAADTAPAVPDFVEFPPPPPHLR